MKTQIKQTIAKLSALAFVFALVVGVAPSNAEIDDTRTVDINAVVAASLQLQVDTGAVTINVDPDVNDGKNANTGGVVTDSTTTSVQTNNQAGYELSIKLAGATNTGTAVLDSTTLTTPVSINAGDYNSENTFGFALGTSTGTTVTPFTNTSDVIAGSQHGQATNNHDQTIYYYLNVDYTIPADTYAGTVTYTASQI